MAIVPTQQCTECLQVMPRDPKYFPRVVGCTVTLQTICRTCKKGLKRKKALNRLEGAAIGAFIAKSVSGGPNIPHTAEMLESLMNYFGGVNGFASMAMKQFYDAPPGSRMRSSVLELVARLAAKNTEQGGARKPIQLYSEEELQSEIDKRIEQQILLHGGRTFIDGQIQEAARLPSPAGSPDGPVHVGIPARRTDELAGGTSRTPDGISEALPANPEAVGISPVDGERDAGDRRQSVG